MNKKTIFESAKIEARIKGFGSIWYTRRPFDDALTALDSKKANIITAEQLAYACMQRKQNHQLFKEGSFVREGALYFSHTNTPRIWVRESLILQNPSEAVQVHEQLKGYNPNKKMNLIPYKYQIDEYLEQVGKDNYFILNDTSSIPTERFGEDERTVWLFLKQAKEYGLFLNDSGISQMDVYMNNTKDEIGRGVSAYQLYLNRSGHNEVHNNRVRWQGIEYISGNNSLCYSRVKIRGVCLESTIKTNSMN